MEKSRKSTAEEQTTAPSGDVMTLPLRKTYLPTCCSCSLSGPALAAATLLGPVPQASRWLGLLSLGLPLLGLQALGLCSHCQTPTLPGLHSGLLPSGCRSQWAAALLASRSQGLYYWHSAILTYHSLGLPLSWPPFSRPSTL